MGNSLDDVQRVISALGDVWASVDREGVTRGWHGDAFGLFGVRSEQLEGRAFETLFEPSSLSVHDPRVSHRLRTGEPTTDWRNARLLASKADGSSLPVEVTLVSLSEEGADLIAVFRRCEVATAPSEHDKLMALTRSVSSYTGDAFFDRLAAYLARSLDAEYVFIGEFFERDGLWARTVTLYVDGQPSQNMEYRLQGTPCASVRVAPGVCAWTRDVQATFPTDVLLTEMGAQAYAGVPLHDSKQTPLGLLVAIFRTPQVEIRGATALLEVASLRAASELERRTLAASAERAAALLEASTNEIYLIDATRMRFVEVNHSARTNLGYSAEELRSMGPLDIRGEEDRPALGRVLEPLRSGALDRVSVHTEHRRRDGSKYPIDLTVQRLSVQGKEFFLGIGTDVTARRALESQLLHAQKMEAVGRLAGGVAHDFNNALTVILGNAELAKRKLVTGQALATSLDAVIEAGHRAADVTRQLLTFARRQVLKPEVLDPAARLRGVERLLRPVLGEDVHIELQITADNAKIRMDPGQFEQLLMNLAVNARDAMPRGGTLTLACSTLEVGAGDVHAQEGLAAGHYTELIVADDGVGMDPSIVSRIFEPFFTTKDAGRGTGLGLATCHGIVKQSGGHISVSSELGRGTTFRIYLPAVHAEPDQPRFISDAPRSSRRGQHILVVEDDRSVREMCANALRSLGYEVTEAASGSDAAVAARESVRPIEVLMTDVVLGDMRGPDVAERVSEIFPNCRRFYVRLHRRLGPRGESGKASELLTETVHPVAARVGDGESVRRGRRLIGLPTLSPCMTRPLRQIRTPWPRPR